MRMMILAGRRYPSPGFRLISRGGLALLRNFKRSAHTFIEFDLLPSIRRILYGRIPTADLAPLLFTTIAPETALKLAGHLSLSTGSRPLGSAGEGAAELSGAEVAPLIRMAWPYILMQMRGPTRARQRSA